MRGHGDASAPNFPETTDVIIVGAGAAGLAAAIFARRFDSSRSVFVLDGAKRPGAKILISGGSRCNVTNTVVSERDFCGGRSTIVRRVLRAFTAADAAAFFRDIGVPLHEEADGKLFPDSNRSRDVLDALLHELSARGAILLPDHRVASVSPHTDGFRIDTSRAAFHASSVVLATGGLSLPKTGSDGGGLEIARRLGHTVVPTTPALAPLVLDADTSFHRAVSGVSHDAEIAIWIDGAVYTRLRGSLLWTHFGVSGPLALNASRHWCRARQEGHRVDATLNFFPGRSFEDLDRRLIDATDETPKTAVQNFLASRIPAALAAALLRQIAIDGRVTLAHLPRDARRRLARSLVEWPLPVVDTRGYNFAEATAGGIALEEIDPSTMESRVCRGIYLVGEMLDVDGRIGGFNFQWAWSTGFVAGRALARRSRERPGN